MNKHTIVRKIIAALHASLEIYTRSAREAHAGATDEQNKAENKYDTRGLEASYLAAGQARQVAELEAAITAFTMLPARAFAPGEGIGLGALVELEQNGERTLYFMGPSAGGTEAKCGKREVLVITPQSPLGSQLQGRQQGDWLNLALGITKRRVQVLSVA